MTGSPALLVIEGRAPRRSSFPIRSRSRLAKEPTPQEIQLGAPIHLAFEELQPIHLPFGLALAPGQVEGRADRRVVPTDAFGERRQFAHATGSARPSQASSWSPCRACRSAKQVLHDVVCGGDDRVATQEFVHEGGLVRRAVASWAQQEPADLARRGAHRRGQGRGERRLAWVRPGVAGTHAPAPEEAEEAVEAGRTAAVTPPGDLAQEFWPMLFAGIPACTQVVHARRVQSPSEGSHDCGAAQGLGRGWAGLGP